MEWAVFIAGALICLLGAFGVVTRTNPVHAALSLVGTLWGMAVLFIAQEAEFLAAVQVIVYAGSIVVLFLFVIMLLGGAITGAESVSAPFDPNAANPLEIGRLLFTDYLWAFEITSVLLVIAVTGAVVLARHRPDSFVDDELPGDVLPIETEDAR